MQIPRIKQTIKKVFGGYKSLIERIRTILRERGIAINSIFTAFTMTVSTIVFSITGVFGGEYPAASW